MAAARTTPQGEGTLQAAVASIEARVREQVFSVPLQAVARTQAAARAPDGTVKTENRCCRYSDRTWVAEAPWDMNVWAATLVQ